MSQRFLRLFVLAMALASFVSGAATIRFSSWVPMCTSNILFARGIARFSDFNDIVRLAALPNPFADGFEYPAGAFVPIKAFAAVTLPVDQWLLVGRVYDWASANLPAGAVESCPPVELLPAHALLAFAGAIGLAVLAGIYFMRGASSGVKWTAAIITATGFLITIGLVELYNLLVLAVGGITLLGLFVAHLRRRPISAWWVIPFLATSYPVVYAVDRGNLDVLAFALIAVTVAVWQSPRFGRARPHVAAVLLAVAVTIKLWPVYLLGWFARRRHAWGIVTFGIASLAMLAAGSALVNMTVVESTQQLLSRMGTRSDSFENEWLLVFNRTLFSIPGYLIAAFGGLDAWHAAARVWAPVQQVLAQLISLVAMALMVLPVRLWVRFGLASAAMVLFSFSSSPYRLTVILIAAALVARYLTDHPGEDDRRLSWLAVLVGLNVAPLYLWSWPGLSPLGVDPSDTLIGSSLMLALLVLFGWFAASDLRQRRSVEGTPAP